MYPIPHLHSFSSSLHGASVLVKIDLVKVYNQIPVMLEDIPKTITSLLGLFKFLRMLFGLRNAVQTFQCFINTALCGLPFVYAYINDLLVASSSKEEHKQNLHLLFQQLMDYGVIINPNKCAFGVTSLSFQGHVIDKNRIQPPPEKVKIMLDYPAPTTLWKLHKFHRFIKFYRRLLPHCMQVVQPLTDLFQHRTKKNKPINLTDHEFHSFTQTERSIGQGYDASFFLRQASLFT